MFAVTIAFDFGTANSWASTLPLQGTNQIPHHYASINQAEANWQNIQGKTQEAIANITGDPKNQIAGKAKQFESQARNSAEAIHNQADDFNGRVQAVTKNIEGKAQDAKGKATNSYPDQIVGKSKQVESQARNVLEDVKETVRNIFD